MVNPNASISPDRGFSLILATIVVGLVLAGATMTIEAALTSSRARQTLSGSLAAQQIAEAGLHKAVYCLNATSGTNCGGTYGITFTGETDAPFGGGTYTTTVTGSGAYRTIESVGRSGGGWTRTVLADVTTLPSTDDTQFAYALQTGTGGAYLENNAAVSGTIYANSNISCQSTNAIISGDAYVAKADGVIQSCRVNTNAHADRILSSRVKNAYYRTDPADISGTTVTGTKYPGSDTPVSRDLPSFDLDFWRSSATAGGAITGDYHPADNSHLGPVKIVGNLVMNNNVDVIIDGPVWVMGNITTGNGNSFTLNSSFGSYSTVILADNSSDPANSGRITISNNTSINGSGQPTSHLLFVSTSTANTDATPALTVSNNADGAVFMATNGTMRLINNAGAKSLAAHRLSLSQNSVVNYVQSDFSGAFANSPGGVWHLVEGTWRETK